MSELRIGGIGIEIIKSTKPPPVKGKRFAFQNFWQTNSNTGRAAWPLLILGLASGCVALAFGKRSLTIDEQMSDVVNTYRPFSGYFNEVFTSLVVFNAIDDAQLLSQCLFFGALINGIVSLITAYFMIAGAGRRSRKALTTFILLGLGNGCGFATMGVISLILGAQLADMKDSFSDACGRLDADTVAQRYCGYDTDDLFDQLRIDYLGGGIPLLFAGVALLICFALQWHAQSVIESTPLVDTDASFPVEKVSQVAQIFPLRPNGENWMEVPGMSNNAPGVGQASVIVQNSIPAPVNVAPALHAFSAAQVPPANGPDLSLAPNGNINNNNNNNNNNNGMDFHAMAAQMEQLGEVDAAQQYREAAQQMAQYQQ